MTEQWSAGEERSAPQPHRMVPEPEPQLERQPEKGGGPRTGLVIGAIVAAALFAGGYSMNWFSPSATAPQPSAITASAPAPQQHGFSFLQPVSAGDQATALSVLVMGDADKAAVTKAVQNGSAKLAWLAFSDSGTEDGDIVTISGASFSQTVPLLKKETRLAVPYAPGQPIKVIATKDGFAPGVTVAVNVGGNLFKLKTLREGDAVEIAAP